MTQNFLKKEKLGPILTLTITQSYSLNIFDPEVLIGLTFAIHNAQTNPEIKVIVITGAGYSIKKESYQSSSIDSPSFFRSDVHSGILNECILAIKRSEKPVICSVNGFIAGIWLGIAFASDYIIASEDCHFNYLSIERQNGIPSGFLSRLIGPFLENQFHNSDGELSAVCLYQLGAVNYLVSLERLQEETTRLAIKLASSPKQTFSLLKTLLDHSLTVSLEEILEQERYKQTLNSISQTHDKEDPYC